MRSYLFIELWIIGNLLFAFLRAVAIIWLVSVALFGSMGCNLTRVTDTVTLPPPATSTAVDSWKLLAQGIERRDLTFRLLEGGEARAVLLRLDPALVAFKVHYSPGEPYTISGWRDLLPQAGVILNGSFFDESRRALGMVVSDGQVYGQSLVGFGGMFQVSPGSVRVRSLVGEPYEGEELLQAVQAFPMLIEAGGMLAPQDEGFAQRSRRTVIAQDWQGRIVVAVISHERVSLADLQGWLITSDLNLSIALALDGGKSTGMTINVLGHSETVASLDEVPSVIAVYLR